MQVIGDVSPKNPPMSQDMRLTFNQANSPPTLVSAKNFLGLGVLSTDHYWGDGLKGEDGRDHEFFINTVYLALG
jgi:hypothetical protein